MATKKHENVGNHSFSKEQIVKSRRFANETDLLNALLQNNQDYTMDEVKTIIHDFKKGKVD